MAARFITAMTATGSVGLIKAPKTSAQPSGTMTPSQPAASQKAKPTTTVEINTPIVLKMMMGQRPLRMCDQSTCSAPANSRKDNIPSIRVRWKSSCPRKALNCGASWLDGINRSTTSTSREAIAPITVNPTEAGKRSQRWLA
jgi:hypothetical protein